MCPYYNRNLKRQNGSISIITIFCLNVKIITELSKALKDVASMKNQAENLSAEYDRLCDEKNSLERKLAIQGTGDKKDD